MATSGADKGHRGTPRVTRLFVSKKLLHATIFDILEYRVNGLQDILQTLGVITLLSHKSGFYRGQHSHGQRASNRQRLSRQPHTPAIPLGPHIFHLR